MAGVPRASSSVRVALYYDDNAYVERHRPTGHGKNETYGLMGRQVAGREFLDAYLSHGNWSELLAVVPRASYRESLYETCHHHPSSRTRRRRLKILDLPAFAAQMGTAPPTEVVHFPCPPDARFAWVRESFGAPRFALCGVTHTLASQAAIEALCQLVTAPYESYDRLICTSRAVVGMVNSVIDSYCEYLSRRFGARVRPRIQTELIPLGVDVDKYRPANPQEREQSRRRWEIDDDEFVVLFVGRLAHHAKAHPFPMYRAVAEAARQTGRKLCLLLAGWSATPAVHEAFRDGAAQFSPNVRTLLLDGNQPDVRTSVWRAADVFLSLSDNIQETFGLVITEALASGLPVVASDWNGYRDLVEDGETGFLIPTAMVQGATCELTRQLWLGEVNYDHFLARSNQCVAVDSSAAASALIQLIEDVPRRKHMGIRARAVAIERFSWRTVIRAYEQLWRKQSAELAKAIGSSDARAGVSRTGQGGPSIYPALEHSFAGYPSHWLGDEHLVHAAPDAVQRLPQVASLPLTNYQREQRCHDLALLEQVLLFAAQQHSVRELEAQVAPEQFTRAQRLATIAWMLKYDLLRFSPDTD